MITLPPCLTRSAPSDNAAIHALGKADGEMHLDGPCWAERREAGMRACSGKTPPVCYSDLYVMGGAVFSPPLRGLEQQGHWALALEPEVLHWSRSKALLFLACLLSCLLACLFVCLLACLLAQCMLFHPQWS